MNVLTGYSPLPREGLSRRLILLVLLFAVAGTCVGGSSAVTISTESAMRDQRGQPLRDCLQPHIYKFGDTWYAYGFDARDFKSACYSTTNFVAWTQRSENDPAGQACLFVLYNRKNGEYVGIGQRYGEVALVYTSPSPTGPFKLRNEMHDYRGHGLGDITVFQDTDGKAYLVYNKFRGEIPQRFSYIYQMDENYYDVVESSLCDTHQVMEGFWMIRRGDVYYLFGSGLWTYDVGDNFYLTAPSPLGPWTYRGLFVPAGSKTFASQTFRGLEIVGPKGTAYAFIGHRWNGLQPNKNGGFTNSCSIWLPLTFNADASVRELKWCDSWKLDLDGGAPELIEK